MSNEEKTNDLYENFEKGGVVEKRGGGGNEIHAPCACEQKDIIELTFHNFIATLSARAGSANIYVYNSCVHRIHIPDSYTLVEEIPVQLKIGGGYKECS